MKKKTFIFKAMIALAIPAMFVACNKEIQQPAKVSNAGYTVSSATQASQIINVYPKKYAGSSTLGDTARNGN